MLFTFGLCIQGKHQLLAHVSSKENEQKVMIDHLQSGGMPMASLHKPVTITKDECKSYSWPKEVAIITNYAMHCLAT